MTQHAAIESPLIFTVASVTAIAEARVEESRPRAAASAPRLARVVPVKWCAALGAAFIVVQAGVLVAWVAGPWFHHVSPGPTPVPGNMKAAMTAFRVILPTAGLSVVYLFVVPPCRREKRLSTDGLLVVAFGFL
jgi:hypothetical protein